MATSQLPFVGNYNFLVEIEGVEGSSSLVVGGFSEVSGLGSETDTIEFAVGNSSSVMHLPGKTRY